MGGKSSTSSQQVSVPPAVLAQYNSVNAKANATAATPFQQYGGQFVAPVNDQQSQGIAGVNANANSAQPYFQAATGQLGQAQSSANGVNNAALGLAAGSAQAVNPTDLDSASIQKYLSPYLSQVLGSTAGILNQNNQQQQAGQLGTAISSGAFGGDRSGIAAANLEQQQNLSNAQIYSGIENEGYNNALGVAQQQQGVGLAAGQANRAALGTAAQTVAGIGQTAYGEGANTASELAGLGTGAQTAGLQGAQAQIGAGTLQQQTQQANDTALYNQFLQQQSYPFQVDQFLANIAEGTGSLSGSTTTTTQPGGFFSDKRLKHDIRKVGKTFDGQDIVTYKMHGDDRTMMGLIAQDVEKKRPEAVGLARGYKIVDYGKATEKAANKGHFAAGGIVPRKMYAVGGGPSIVDSGDLSAILQAQQAMYAPMAGSAGVYGGEGGSVPRGGSSRVPAPTGAISHLVTAQGGLKPQASGAENVKNVAELERLGRGIYKDYSSSHGSSSGGFDPNGTGSIDSMGDPGMLGDLSSVATTDPVETDMRRGGVAGYADGGAPYDYSKLDIPDDQNSRSLATAGSLGQGGKGGIDLGDVVKIAGIAAAFMNRGGRTGYATGGGPELLDIPDDKSQSTLSVAPSQQQKSSSGFDQVLDLVKDFVAKGGRINRASGGLAGRRGYDDGGDVEQWPESVVESRPIPPATYDGGVSIAPTYVPQDDVPQLPTGVAPPKDAPVKDEPKADDSAPKDHWYKHAENIVPLLTGLAAMGTAPTRSLGVALASGLGAGAQSWLPAQQEVATREQTQANTAGIGLRNQIQQKKLDYLNGPAPQPTVTKPQPALPPDAPLPDQLRNKYTVPPITQDESNQLQQARQKAIALGSDQPVKAVHDAIAARKDSQDYTNKWEAQQRYDEAIQVAKTTQNPAVKASALSAANAYQQYTGDEQISQDGVEKNKRTLEPFVGDQAQRISPVAYTTMMAKALEKSAVPTGNPGETVMLPAWQIAGARSAADYVASLPPPGTPGVPGQAATPQQGRPMAAPVAAPNVTPRAPVSAPASTPPVAPRSVAAPVAITPPISAPPTKAVDPLTKALADPKYNLPPQTRQIGLTPGKSAENQVQATSEKRKELNDDAESTTQSSGTALQFALAAKQILDSKGAPVTGIFGPAMKAVTSTYGGVNASNYEEVAKYLGNLAVQTGKGNFPHATEKENMVQFNDLSPATTQTGAALRSLLDSNIRTSQYTLDTANRVSNYLDPKYNKDPQKFFRWNQENFPRQDLSKSTVSTVGTQEGAETTSKSGKPLIYQNGHWQYKGT